MRARNHSVRLIGWVLVGCLTLPLGMAYAQAPVIRIESPAGEPRHTSSGDPMTAAVTLPVVLSFPIVETPCSGANPPVIRETLEVYLVRVIDGVVQTPPEENQWLIDTSEWIWTGTAPDRIEGEVTIGGPDSGQDRSRYGIKVCIDNAAVEGQCVTGGWMRFERPVSEFVGGTYPYTWVKGFSQSPAGCVLGAKLEPAINSALKSAPPFAVVAPGYDQYPAIVQFLTLPMIGSVAFPDSYLDPVDNNVVLGPVGIAGIDLGPVGLPGYNCRVGGTASGVLYGEVSPYEDLDGRLSISGIEITTGTGSGGCSLPQPAPDCTLFLAIDGNKTN